MGKTYFTYIMSNKSRRLYVGTTSELQARVFKHKKGWYQGSFTARYCFDMLVSASQRRHCPRKRNQSLATREEVTAGAGNESGLG